MRPRVIIHNAISLDGRIDRFSVDLGLYYGIAGRFEEDATLVGSETLLQSPEGAAFLQEPVEGSTPLPEKTDGDDRALLVVPDSRGRIRNWNFLRRLPYWRDIVVLAASLTPADHFERLKKQGVSYFVAGRERVDFAAAMDSLYNRYGVRTVRVDSGGTLNGVLLRAGLVDEVSLLIHPLLVGGPSLKSVFHSPDSAPEESPLPLKLTQLEKLAGDVVWVRYKIAGP
jgi:2,5-diamino-6-(ribosylamino)-4(3H)-pyrimidinone 5'-phosphate reductase